MRRTGRWQVAGVGEVAVHAGTPCRRVSRAAGVPSRRSAAFAECLGTGPQASPGLAYHSGSMLHKSGM